MSRLEDFFPFYPELNNSSAINNYKEFTSIMLDEIEQFPSKQGASMKHQIVIRRLLSGFTRFDALLLVHDMGTGKTCSAIQAIEQNLGETNLFGREAGPTGALILTRGKTLMNNFMHELVYKCSIKYMSASMKASKSMFSKLYSFSTFEVFAKTVAEMSEREIAVKFENKFIVIDEAHNIRTIHAEGAAALDVYHEMHRFLHILKNKKVLLLTGTPMKDGPQEIASLMNLILPLERQMPTQKEFLKEFFPENATRMDNTQRFKDHIRGYISFLKSMTSDTTFGAQKVMVGERIGALQHYKVVVSTMSKFQSDIYQSAFAQDKQEKGIYSNSRQASRFVFPDKSFGSEGFVKYVLERHKKGGKAFSMTSEFKNSVMTDGKPDIDKIRTFSAKYATIIEQIISAEQSGELTIVYDDAVKGSGLIVLTLLLELFGFRRNFGFKHITRSYGICSNETTSVYEIKVIQSIFNNEANIHGAIMPVVFGSRVIAEGLSFKNVIHEHVVPHWNASETEQVIARGWRLGSHRLLQARGSAVSMFVYRHCSIPQTKLLEDSIDLVMYEVSERKDIAIAQVTRCLREVAVDCELFKRRNQKNATHDFSRDCEYQQCAYKCDVAVNRANRADVTNFETLFSKEREDELIQAIEAHLQTVDCVATFDELFALLQSHRPEVTATELLRVLHKVVNRDLVIRNVHGFPCVLREVNNVFFLSDSISSEALGNAYYTAHPKLILDESDHDYLLTGFLNKNTPQQISQLCSSSFESEINLLPETAQQRLLEAAITAENSAKELQRSNEQQRLTCKILSRFKNNFSIIRKNDGSFKLAIVTLSLDSERCLYNNGENAFFEWRLCDKRDKQRIRETRTATRAYFEHAAREVGYYGVENPRSKDFCIRALAQPTTSSLRSSGAQDWSEYDGKDSLAVPKDKRYIASGKRCVNWTKKELSILAVDVAHIPMFEQPPSLSEAHKLLRISGFDPACNDEEERVIHLGFWLSQSRETICSHLYAWFSAHNLIAEDASCGVQTKRK